MNDSNFNRFSENARKVLLSAQFMAAQSHHKTSTGHILLSILLHKDSLAHGLLLSHQASADRIESELHQLEVADRKTRSSLPALADETKSCLDRAMTIATRFGHVGVDTEHLLLSCVSDQTYRASRILEQLGVSPNRIKQQIATLFQELQQFDSGVREGAMERLPVQHDSGFDTDLHSEHGPADMVPGVDMPSFQTGPDSKKRRQSILDYFSTDLTKLAEEKKLDPVIGRETEMSRTIEILSRRAKNNPVLIGEPGVGKTAIVEGIASRIVSGDVPASLVGTRMLSLDLAMLVAGTMYRGQFEERIKKIIDELSHLHNAILFIDELHTIIGAGAAEGSLDAAQILKPSLAKGHLRVIGATTLDEFQKHIEKDAALTRRFQSVVVEEPSLDQTKAIMAGIKAQYEVFHHVTISDEAIDASVTLSARYVNDRFLPDKAIDLIDEAAAAIQSHNRVHKQIAEGVLKLDSLVKAKEQAVLAERYTEASMLQKKAEKLAHALEKTRERASARPAPLITKSDIETVVSRLTGIPAGDLDHEALLSIRMLDETLKRHIVGQNEAIQAVTKVIRRSRTGINQTTRPIGSFIFMGPSGVGKTELAKTIARHIYGSESALMKIDMSEFMERHNVSRLVGAPAGYVGYEEGGKLTEMIRRKPYCVVLLDEIEKAHPDVSNMLLQILEDGYVTDARGRKIDFRNTLIIMTSNIGITELTKSALGFAQNQNLAAEQAYESTKRECLKQLKDHFRPEFLNRIDQVVVFGPLSKEHIRHIVDIQIAELLERTGAKGLKVQVDASARKLIAEKGFDPVNGARPIRRYIQDTVEDLIAGAIINGTLDKRKTRIVRNLGNELVLT